jgi:hypothetical protein
MEHLTPSTAPHAYVWMVYECFATPTSDMRSLMYSADMSRKRSLT